MTGQKLKNSILQMAIQGKLVPQNPHDEPASFLLERISQEKRKMAKEGKIRKSELVETPISEDNIPFDIPDSWKWVRLKSIVSILGDGIHGTPNYDIHGNYYFINGNNLSNNKIVIKANTGKVNEIEYQKYKKELNNKTIFVSINGTIGNVGHYNGEPVILGKSACYFNLIDINLKVYVTILLYTDYFLNYAKDNATGSTIKNVSLEVMKNFLIPLPPLAEQQRIVKKIEELMPIIEKYGNIQETLDKHNAALPDKLRQSILQEAIQGRLVPQDPNDEPASVLLDRIRKEKARLVKEGKLKKKDLEEKPISPDEIPFDIPEGWEWIRIGYVYQTTSGGTPEKGHPEYYNGNIHWAKVGDLTQKYINSTEEKISEEAIKNSSAKVFPKDTILVAMYCNDAIGKSSILSVPMATNQAICGLLPNPLLMKEYIYYAIQKNKSVLQASAAGGAQKNINQKIVNELLIPLPPLAEQQRIVTKIEELMPKIDRLVK